MLFAVIMRFDSLGEIKIVITVEVIKLYHIGVDIPRCCMLSDVNARCSENIFEAIIQQQ